MRLPENVEPGPLVRIRRFALAPLRNSRADPQYAVPSAPGSLRWPSAASVSVTAPRASARPNVGHTHCTPPAGPLSIYHREPEEGCRCSPNRSRFPQRGGASFPVPLRLRVLIVDDNEDVTDSMAGLLRLFGADVDVRYCAEDALDDPEHLRADARVLDLSMPGMDGCELARATRAMGGKQPLLVALTAFGDAETRRKTEACGFDLHLAKPVDPVVLLHALGEQMHRMHGPV